ncbi:phosphoesterase [Cavenderia fasciculata]|uniref:Phosphoesterase n=1 Tax=Cavenderia fasciculata TaxID=261658 RepID=F4QB10_CACFS|nr:phosphoesterase [Cavenderia fasciculata]EGG14782.1 phosphoesterase [Cavenderia fasciculata]|eukprot:XP_004351298.1 phosphoesterase [Cavenderia fasciculata]
MKSVILLLLLISLLAVSQVSAMNTVNCTNVNGDNFFNKCMMNNENVLPLMANFIMQFVNPRTVAYTVTSLLLILPAMFLVGASPSVYPALKNKYVSMRITIVHMLHRAAYPLVLGVGLYAIFRQRRPCECNGVHVGSYYGMPSGDAMAGGILGAFLIDSAPFYPLFARVAGVLLMACVCFERTILGFHTVGQVLTGTSIGFFLHFYSTRVPQWVLIIDIIAQWVLSILALQLDKDLVYASNDPNNLWVWFVWGLSFQILVLFHLFRLGKNPLTGWSILKKSYNAMSKPDLNIQAEAHDQLLSFSISPVCYITIKMSRTSDDEESRERLNRRIVMDSDIVFTVIAFIPFLAVNFISYCMQNWNWMVRTSSSANGGTHM